MDRKEKCERVILTPNERKLLRDVKRHPHRKCSQAEVWPLYTMGLVQPDTAGTDALGQPVLKDTYCVSRFYEVYRAYQCSKHRALFLSSLWLPILVSVLTNLTINELQRLWPLLLQWFSTRP